MLFVHCPQVFPLLGAGLHMPASTAGVLALTALTRTVVQLTLVILFPQVVQLLDAAPHMPASTAGVFAQTALTRT